MTEAEVRARIMLFADAGVEPKISAEDMDVLIPMCKVVDKYGVWPSETSWAETYDVNYAIALAWLVKAGRLADRYLFMSGGKMFSRNQFYEHCMALHRKYLMKSPLKAARLGPEQDTLESIINNT